MTLRRAPEPIAPQPLPQSEAHRALLAQAHESWLAWRILPWWRRALIRAACPRLVRSIAAGSRLAAADLPMPKEARPRGWSPWRASRWVGGAVGSRREG